MVGPDPREEIVEAQFNWCLPGSMSVNHCHIRMFKRNAGAIVIASDIPEDPHPGISVTNGAEHIATEVMTRYSLSPNFVIYVERYPAGPGPKGRPETFDLVQFNYIAEEHRFTAPRWVRINKSVVDALLAT